MSSCSHPSLQRREPLGAPPQRSLLTVLGNECPKPRGRTSRHGSLRIYQPIAVEKGAVARLKHYLLVLSSCRA